MFCIQKHQRQTNGKSLKRSLKALQRHRCRVFGYWQNQKTNIKSYYFWKGSEVVERKFAYATEIAREALLNTGILNIE